MKKLILAAILIMLIALPIVSAGTRHDVEVSTTQPFFYTVPSRDIMVFDYPVRIYELPREENNETIIEFNVEEQQQALKVEKIFDKNGIYHAQLAMFIKDAPFPYYTEVKATDAIRYDFEFDELDDIELQILAINPEEGVTVLIIPQDNALEVPTPHIFVNETGVEGPQRREVEVTGGGETNQPTRDRILDKITGVSIGELANNRNVVGAVLLIIILLVLNRRSIKKFFLHRKNSKLRSEEKKEEPKEEIKVEEEKVE